MRRRQLNLTVLAVLAMLAGPTCAVADSGPSAGDNQYVDPLAGTTTPKRTPTTPAAGSQPTPPRPPATPTSSGSASSPAGSQSAAPPATAAAAGPSASPASHPRGDLPFTGSEVWLIGILGVGLTATGGLLRLRAE